MPNKHWAEASKEKTISLGGMDSIKYVEPVKSTANNSTKEEKAERKVSKEAELIRKKSQTSFNFGEEVMTPESIAEMNAFLDEKIKSFGTHPNDEKEEAEDIKLVKKMVKKPALKDGVDEALNLSGLKKGALHKDLGISKDKKIPVKKLTVTSNDSPLEVKRKTFASNAKKWQHESVMESFIIDELSFVKTSPITSSLAEAIAMVMEAK